MSSSREAGAMLRSLVLTLLWLSGMTLAPVALAQARAAGTHDLHPGVPIHAVYHFDADGEGTMTALHQVKNTLAVYPTANIVVVAIGKSVPFLTKNAMTQGGYPFKLMVQALQEKGVRFEACGNTMKTLKISPGQLDDGVVVVPSGMAELARLEWREGYAYLRP